MSLNNVKLRIEHLLNSGLIGQRKTINKLSPQEHQQFLQDLQDTRQWLHKQPASANKKMALLILKMLEVQANNYYQPIKSILDDFD